MEAQQRQLFNSVGKQQVYLTTRVSIIRFPPHSVCIQKHTADKVLNVKNSTVSVLEKDQKYFCFCVISDCWQHAGTYRTGGLVTEFAPVSLLWTLGVDFGQGFTCQPLGEPPTSFVRAGRWFFPPEWVGNSVT